MKLETHSERVERELRDAHTEHRVVPGRTLPRGRQWVGHDIPGRGAAAGRRLKQIAAAKAKETTMTHEELKRAAVECLGKVFKGNTTIEPHVVQAAVAVLLSPDLSTPGPVSGDTQVQTAA